MPIPKLSVSCSLLPDWRCELRKARLNAELNRVLNLAAVREKLSVQGIDVAGGTPEDFGAVMRADLPAFARIVKATNIRSD